ncbi:Hypp2074 [Branchiostoma lanceolatum]|uniref:Hypp2074 protein n=1 Tax=Branchiostoma lanceolatum TaxID=7740 RepID=A0A8J9ZRF5_BRALA|nr:Hypp2074 [Branchiostoma lanceolatum]
MAKPIITCFHLFLVAAAGWEMSFGIPSNLWDLCPDNCNHGRDEDDVPWPSGCKERSGWIWCTSTCAPDESNMYYECLWCDSCITGKYLSRGACFDCRRNVADCEDYTCTTSTNSRCIQCMHDRGPGKKAYQLSSNGRTCTELCSWRRIFCYPGSCGSSNRPAYCTCATEFGGQNCLTMTARPTMQYCLGKVKRVENGAEKDTVEAGCMSTTATSTSWTNLRLTASTMQFEAEWKTSFQPSLTAWPRQYYINAYLVGVIAASADWRMERGGTSIRQGTMTCKLSNRDSPNTSMQDCTKNVMIPEEAQHGDEVHFTTKASNGGYVRIRNFDYSYLSTRTFYYTGREVSHSAHFTFDFHDPYHCSTRGPCTGEMLERGQAITKNGDITLRWSGWRDDDSGIGEYEYEVFKLRPFGEMLGMRGLSPIAGQTGTVGAAATQASIHLTEPGVYCIVLTVEDGCGPNDGNFVIARRFLIYDDNSTVEADTSGHHPMWAESASNVTGRVWQTNLQDGMGHGPQVTVSWPDHFCNQFHKHNKFLNAIEEHSSTILPGYEELTGQPPATRSREAIPNVNTIMMFQTDWAVDHQGGRSLGSPPGNWQNVTDMTSQSQSHDIPRQDGDTVRYWVRAFDVMGNFVDDYVTIHVDSSPPVIEDIFLSRGGVDTLAVHHSQDLFEMTVVFSAYDDHSGLHNIHWELHDMADPAVVHGEGQVAVRRPSTLHPECPPPFCTCIPKDEECYFRNHEFTPDANKMNISTGTHDHDYYIVITATNNAMLQSQGRFQITVDTSPPLPGHVHDSLPAETDLDFQQDSIIQASWEGFFDRESGVIFYMYGFAEECLTLENVTQFGNNLTVR